MKNPSFSLRFPLPRVHAAPLLGGLWCGIVFLSAPGRAENLVTSFEESEGFSSGALAAGHGGWEGTSAGMVTSHLLVTGEEAYQGTQSLLASNEAGAYAYAQSPNLYDSGVSAVSFYFKNPTAEFSEPDQVVARWEVMFGDSASEAGHRVVLQLRYSSAKAYHVNVSSATEALAEARANASK